MTVRKYFVWVERVFLVCIVLFATVAFNAHSLSGLALIYDVAIIITGILGLVLLR